MNRHYLQWLSIFCILYSPSIDIVLLDEPDAHLHACLQSELLEQLEAIPSEENEKQIIVSSHSVEMIKQAPLDLIFSVDKRKYLREEASRVAVLNGIGSEYHPKIDLLKKYKKMVVMENESDKKIISLLGEKCGMKMPEDIVFWYGTGSHAERKQLFSELHRVIPELRCISLRDRDMDNPNVIDNNLDYKMMKKVQNEEYMLFLEWKRTNIESYLICPAAIAKASGKTVDEVKEHLRVSQALNVDDDGYTVSDAPNTILCFDGKKVFGEGENSISQKFGCDKYAVAKAMTEDEVCDDIRKFLSRLTSHFAD